MGRGHLRLAGLRVSHFAGRALGGVQLADAGDRHGLAALQRRLGDAGKDRVDDDRVFRTGIVDADARITSYNVCYTKLLRTKKRRKAHS